MTFLRRSTLLATLAFVHANNNDTNAGSNRDTSLTFLYQNNLNLTDDANHIGAILLDPMPIDQATSACETLNESLLNSTAIKQHAQDFTDLLAYVEYSGKVASNQSYSIADGYVRYDSSSSSKLVYVGSSDGTGMTLPVLCTQSDQQNYPNATATAGNNVTVISSDASKTYLGFRNQKSFRFIGIPYADTPKRFEYSHLSTKEGVINATSYGPSCSQAGSNTSSEDCLFLNIQTPYLPRQGSNDSLRPVHFWIHGGGYTGGTGADPTSDGGQLASREDIVVVSINYRLGTLGFLAVPGTNITGNYGIADQVVALEWVKANIAAFGGDPDKVTIIGESAGAGSVKALLSVPCANGLFRGAVPMSNLGGGQTLGLDGNYATEYSLYLTINGSYALAGQQIFTGVGCNSTDLNSQIDCLKTANASTISNLATTARYVVQDGAYILAPTLNVYNNNGSTANVHTIWGVTANDGSSFSTYPKTPVANLSSGLQVGLGIDASYAQSIIDSGLFPLYDTGNITADAFNVTQRVATDTQFRCVDQAIVNAGVSSGAFKQSYFYQMDRTYSGYNPNNIDGTGPIEPGYPYGNPNEPYYRLHGSDMPWVFVSPRSWTFDSILTSADSSYPCALTGHTDDAPRRRRPRLDPTRHQLLCQLCPYLRPEPFDRLPSSPRIQHHSRCHPDKRPVAAGYQRNGTDPDHRCQRYDRRVPGVGPVCVLELFDCVLPGHVIAQASNEHNFERISAQDRVKHNLMYKP